MKEFYFDFEKLAVYQKGLELIDYIFTIIEQLPQQYRYSVGDNLIRAGFSITNNIAEGNDKASLKEKARFMGYACDSARECASVFIVLRRKRIIEEEFFWKVKTLAREITSIIRAYVYR